MVGREIQQLYPPRQHRPSSEPVLEARGLSQPGVLHDVGFTLHRGEILGVAGLMGSGRSELARVLFGIEPCRSGEISVHGKPYPRPRARESVRRGVAFLTEDRREEGLMMEGSITDNVALVTLPSFAAPGPTFVSQRRLRTAVGDVTARVRVACRSLRRQVARTLSGGNQQKVVLAKWLLAGPRVLILDEPTRGIDMGARQEIYVLIQELAAAGAGILLISSEIEELIGLCDRIMVMRRGEIAGQVERNEFDRERILAMALAGKAQLTSGI
jgi:ribose transport system ATP-binding protein